MSAGKDRPQRSAAKTIAEDLQQQDIGRFDGLMTFSQAGIVVYRDGIDDFVADETIRFVRDRFPWIQSFFARNFRGGDLEVVRLLYANYELSIVVRSGFVSFLVRIRTRDFAVLNPQTPRLKQRLTRKIASVLSDQKSSLARPMLKMLVEHYGLSFSVVNKAREQLAVEANRKTRRMPVIWRSLKSEIDEFSTDSVGGRNQNATRNSSFETDDQKALKNRSLSKEVLDDFSYDLEYERLIERMYFPVDQVPPSELDQNFRGETDDPQTSQNSVFPGSIVDENVENPADFAVMFDLSWDDSSLRDSGEKDSAAENNIEDRMADLWKLVWESEYGAASSSSSAMVKPYESEFVFSEDPGPCETRVKGSLTDLERSKWRLRSYHDERKRVGARKRDPKTLNHLGIYENMMKRRRRWASKNFFHRPAKRDLKLLKKSVEDLLKKEVWLRNCWEGAAVVWWWTIRNELLKRNLARPKVDGIRKSRLRSYLKTVRECGLRKRYFYRSHNL